MDLEDDVYDQGLSLARPIINFIQSHEAFLIRISAGFCIYENIFIFNTVHYNPLHAVLNKQCMSTFHLL